MKRILKNITNLECALCYFDADGKKISKGNLRGNVSGLTGDVSWLTGDVDDADLSPEDRQKGVAVQNIVEVK